MMNIMMRLPCFALRAVRPPSPDVPIQEGNGLDAGEDVVAVDDSGNDAKGNALQVQRPRNLPEVYLPTAAEVDRHNLLHLHYTRWCKICVACRRKLPHTLPNLAFIDLSVTIL